jgi:hypothetical protein
VKTPLSKAALTASLTRLIENFGLDEFR